jgi:hypothetical protein
VCREDEHLKIEGSECKRPGQFKLRQLVIAIVVTAASIGAAKAEPVVLAPVDLGAWAKLSDDAVKASVEQTLAKCDWELSRMIVLSGGIPTSDRDQLYRSCVSAAGLVRYTPQQFRGAADAWNVKNPRRKARGYEIGQ